ncbi:CopG family ribbon-helix-helix protein [Pseudaminobacter soli (ex Zhang et al. 2022)]|uniref:CopG family ribbon-helix-helix protein n=1 Tax=Pseudaminobacter soli (ex Zhang et al. 2022) TaxID=2831468 RepID=UPI0016614751|nr:antitoxin of toxin-antitoxin stability system [Pseudaminobacter soli]
MAKEAVFTMKLEPELRDAFMAAAKREDRPASQILREFMRDFVERDEEYLEFLRRKVEHSRRQFAAGESLSQEEVDARAAERRRKLMTGLDNEAGS